MMKVMIIIHNQVCSMMVPYLEPTEYIFEERKKHWRKRLPAICRSRCGYAKTGSQASSELSENYFRFDGDNL